MLLLYFGCAFACFASRLDDRNPSGYAQVLEELIPDGVNPLKVTRVYSYGHDLISQQPVAGAESYYGYDGHGNVRFLISAAGDITDTYTYDAFGVLLATTGSTANNYLSCGEQYDFDLGTYYLRARYVNPNTGRFWTMDTYEGSPSDPLSLHKYLYCHSDPVNFTDPSGNVEFSILGINVSIDNRLIIGTLVLTGAAIAYHRYVWDPTEHDMRAIPITELEAELGREPERETRLDQVIDSSGQKKFRDVGLVSGGRMSVVMNTENGRPGQRIRDIWENPKNRAALSSASDELGARFFAARGGANDVGGFINLMANEDAVTTDGRVGIAEALLNRHQAYDKWLQTYIDKKRGQ